MKKAAIIGAVVVVLAGGGFAAWRGLRRDEGPPVPIHVVESGALTETASATGTIEPHVQVEVKSRASGEVIEILVEEGQTVEAGALLVRLDPADAERAVREAMVAQQRASADLAQARANLEVADAESNEANANRDVQERGAQLGLVSEEARRTATHGSRVAQNTITLRRAAVQSAQAALETARLGVEDAQRRLREMEIRAPVSGTVLSLPIEVGSIVSSAVTTVSGGTPLLTLADLSDLRVIGAIDEAQIGRVRPGQPVIVRVDAYPEHEFEGRVERVSPLGETTTNVVTFDVEIAVTDARASLLRSGMSADLEIVTARRDDVLLVPLTAVQSRGAQRTVRMANGAQRTIRTGATDGDRLEVIAGLSAGDRIQRVQQGVGEEAPEARGPLSLGRRRGRR